MADAESPDAANIIKRSHLAYYYAADDGMAEVRMVIVDGRGRERIREFVMLRLDLEEGGRQRYFIYFRKPSDVSRMTFMVHKKIDGDDRRWIYIPSVDLVKPIAASDKNSSFVGSDFSYEDVSGRHWTEDDHRLLGDTTIDSSATFVIESIPREKIKAYARKISYIDKNSMLPLREEQFDSGDNIVRIFRAERIESVDGIMTVTTRSMEQVKKRHKTTITFEQIKYNVGMTEKIFRERSLKAPPRKYIK